MFWIILILLFTIIGYFVDLEDGAMRCLISAAIISLMGTSLLALCPEEWRIYETCSTETVDLKPMDNGEYYTVSPKDNSIVVYFSNGDGTYEHEMYDMNLVSFVPGDRLEMSIVTETLKAIDLFSIEMNVKTFKFMFFLDFTDMERIESITITFPEGTR